MNFLRRLLGMQSPDPAPRDDDHWRVPRDPIPPLAPSSLNPRIRPEPPARADPPRAPAVDPYWDPPRTHQRVAFESRRVPSEGTVRLKGGGRVDVVGESQYRDAIARICGDAGPDGVNLGFMASLVPEPSNPYDPNAVLVVIEGQTVGYLPRAAAIAYRLVAAALGDRVGSCNATIRGGFANGRGQQADFGVTLDLAPPDVLFAALGK